MPCLVCQVLRHQAALTVRPRAPGAVNDERPYVGINNLLSGETQQEEKVNSQEQEKEIGIIITDSNFFI